MSPKKQIAFFYDKARNLALAEVERRARNIMRRHPTLKSFILAMGTASFYDADGPVMEEDKKYLKSFYSFLYDWDEYLKLTGEGFRIAGPFEEIERLAPQLDALRIKESETV